MPKPHPKNCACQLCGTDKDFTLPEHLLQKIKDDEIVLFAGAGISTENELHCQSTFYDQVRAELNISDLPTFPELMTRYCERPDGRIKLLEKIKKRFDYFISFDDFYRPMTRFHRAISPLFMIRDIVTTNWDDFFERECEIDAFKYDSDLAFWDAAPRRLMKIHGSITNFGSIVATTDDYQQSFKRLNDGPLGSHLKSLITRKTVIYVGYSLSDANYLRLLRNIARMMGSNIRQSYFISPSVDPHKLSQSPVPLVAIETDGSFFFERVREILTEDGIVVGDEAFELCEDLLPDVAEQHNKTANLYLKSSIRS